MRIAVIGCGAMGSVYAGLLASSGNEVIVVSRNVAHMSAITADGLRVEGASGDRLVRVRAMTVPPNDVVDLVIIAVKASQAASAARGAGVMIGPRTVILTIQNGLGSAEAVAAVVGKDRLAVGIAGGFGAALRSPGHVFHNGMQVVQIGAYANLDLGDVKEIVRVWRDAGFNTELASDILAMQWEKLICNVAYSAVCALTGLTVGAAMDDPEIGAVSRAAAREAWETAKGLGVAIAVSDPDVHVRSFGAKVYAAKPSLLLDHEVGRRSEIDVINGAIPREAAKIGRTAPVNATLTALVRNKEVSFHA